MSTLAAPSFFRGIASLLYPPSCTICSVSVDLGEYLCQECEAKVSRIVPPFCAKCSEPFDGAITTTFSCANCAHRALHFDAAVSAYRSRGIVRHVILNFKYGRQIHLRHLVARWLVAALDDERLRERRFDVLVPVPLHPAKQRERGFNQAALLGEWLSRVWRCRCSRSCNAFVSIQPKRHWTGPSVCKICAMHSVYEKTETCESYVCF